jgi:hypothetical protein
MDGTVPQPAELHRKGIPLSTNDYFHICGTCFQLYETGRPDGRDQRCDCHTGEEEDWPGVDFNERAILCMCCGTEVLGSGTRWSAYLCRECQLLAMGVSLWERRLVIPVGRHSMMHTWVPDARAPSLAAHGGSVDRLAETVHGTLTVMTRGRAGLSEWSAIVVSRHLRRVRLKGGTSLATYLSAIEKDKKAPTRWALFAELCEFMRTPSPGS